MKKRVHTRFSSNVEIPRLIDFVGMYYDEDGYRIYLKEFAKNNSLIIEVNFGYANLAQRSMDEGSFLKLTADIINNNGEVGPIVIVENSDFLDWFHDQSCGIYDRDKIIHVAILTQNEWIEVLCLELPTVRRMQSASLRPPFSTK